MMNSATFREEGNKLLSTAIDKEIDEKEKVLKKCIMLYQQSITSANTHDDYCSGNKNYSHAAFELFKIYKDIEFKMSDYYLLEALKSSFNSLKYAETEKSKLWIEKMKCKTQLYLYTYIDFVNQNEEKSLIIKTNKIKDLAPDYVITWLNYKLCNIYLNNSIKHLDASISKSYYNVKECSFYYEECFKTIKNQDLLGEIELIDLKESFTIQENVLEGLKQKQNADKLYDVALNGDETLNIELIWDAIDLYRSSIVKTNSKDIEMEAEILSKIGTIYEKILLSKQKAKEYYYKCFELAESMKPRLFNNVSWFMKCKAAIDRFQKQTINEEEKQKEDDKQTVFEVIKDDLNFIKKSSKIDKKEFLKLMYKKYPPKNPKHTLDETLLTESHLKKAYKIAFCHYHPDKIVSSESEKKWFFIFEEINKYIGQIYEQLKGEE